MDRGSNIQEANYNSSSQLTETEESSGCAYNCCNPRGKCHRFIALVFMSLLGFGSYFCFDNPAALKENFTQDLNITTSEFTLFYSLYSWPNVVLCFIGGFLIDRIFGIRLGTNIYMFITLFGQALFASGALFNMFWLMCLGRFIFGIGGESLAVAQNSYAVLWFKGKELNMVFGLQTSLARVGSTVNFWVMEPIYKWVSGSYSGHECLGIVLFIAGAACIISMLASVVMGSLDKRAERILMRNTNTNNEPVRLTDVKDFPVIFWLLSIICVGYYVTIFPFVAISQEFFMKRFNFTAQQANSVNSILYIVSSVASPILGLVIDKCGRNLVWIILSVVMTAGAHAILILSLLNPYVGMVIMGIGLSIFASSLWPLVSLIIPEYQLGTAYGIFQAIQNLGLAVIAYLAGYIAQHCGYFWLEMFFIGCLGVTLTSTILVWCVDSSRKGVLNKTPAQREELAQTLITADKEKLLGEEGSSSNGELVQSTDSQIRNRYLSRIGAPLPLNYAQNMYPPLK